MGLQQRQIFIHKSYLVILGEVMKQSKYNFFFKLEDGKVLAYNALKNGLAVLNSFIVDEITKLKKGANLNLDNDTVNELIRGGFIVTDNFDEYGVLTIRRHLQQYASKGLALTIAPTINCNLACSYCFENPHKLTMSEKVENNLIKFVKDNLNTGSDFFFVTWYGGEPLLCIDKILSLSNEFKKIAKKLKIPYSADIITNGTLYTKDIAYKLKEANVTDVQITLDGYKEMHDVRRPFKAGNKSSFDVICEKLEETVGILPVNLRINVDRENVNKAIDFVKFIKSMDWFDGKFIHPYFGYVRKYTSSCRCSQDECLLAGEFWEKEFELHKFLLKKGITEPAYPSISSGCGATSTNSYVIGPLGELYKCWNHVGEKSQIVGYIDKPVELNELYVNYLHQSFETDKECRDCKFLPICMGGCVDIMIKSKQGLLPEKDCAKWKYYLQKQLELYYTYKIQNV
jgi:uncharacterized protein